MGSDRTENGWKREISQELWQLCFSQPDHQSDNRNRVHHLYRQVNGRPYNCFVVPDPRGGGPFNTDPGVFCTGNGSLQILCGKS